ncbi:hypothetical protein SNEBB_010838 [Seison nebaliae]|nr:hypothetical protein SNEBB_010838 [Seison nebaliae]
MSHGHKRKDQYIIMALQKTWEITNTHTKNITQIGYHQHKREIAVGYEDGCIKFFDMETGVYSSQQHEHTGIITGMFYWYHAKYLYTSSVDGTIISWGTTGLKIGCTNFSKAIYSMLFLEKLQIILVAYDNGLILFHDISHSSKNGECVSRAIRYKLNDHSDIVRTIQTLHNKIYTGGYDGKFCIYLYHMINDELKVQLIAAQSLAHQAGICCLCTRFDRLQNTTFLITGGFDKCVKVWNSEGKYVFSVENFPNAVSSIIHISPPNVFWASCGGSLPHIIDVRTGELLNDNMDVSSTDYLKKNRKNHSYSSSSQQHNHQQQHNQQTKQYVMTGNEIYYLKSIKHFPECTLTLATTSRRGLIAWKYNAYAPVSKINIPYLSDPSEALTHSPSQPMSIFVGSNEKGEIIKYEKKYESQFLYSTEHLTTITQDKIKTDVLENRMVGNKRTLNNSKKSNGFTKLLFLNDKEYLVGACQNGLIYVWGYDNSITTDQLLNKKVNNDEKDNERDENDNIFPTYFNSLCLNAKEILIENHQKRKPTKRVQSAFHRRLIQIENSKEFQETQNQLKDHQMENNEKNKGTKISNFRLIAKLSNQVGPISSMIYIPNFKGIARPVGEERTYNFLLTGGWDGLISIWDMDQICLFDIVRKHRSEVLHIRMNIDTVSHPFDDKLESSSTIEFNDDNFTTNVQDQTEVDEHSNDRKLDGSSYESIVNSAILTMACAQLDNGQLLAYGTSDGQIFIRRMSTNCSNMALLVTIAAHNGEINVIKWLSNRHQWVSGGDDRIIKFWDVDKGNCLYQVQLTNSIYCIELSPSEKHLWVACGNKVNVYDANLFILQHTRLGHSQSIKNLICLKEQNLFVTICSDGTMKFWNVVE